MWARVSSFMQDDTPAESSSADSDSSIEKLSHSQINPNHGDSEWRSRFSFSLGLGEMLYSWGFLRRKPSHPESDTNSPAKVGTLETPSPNENIELNSFTNYQVPCPLWKTAQSQLAPTGTLFSSSPLQVNKANLLCESGTLRAVSSTSSLFDSASLTSFLWEEVEEMESGVGHNFMVSDTNFPMWCDKCGDLLWGLQEEYLRCQSKCWPAAS